MLKRDKIITLRVNSDLLNRVNEKINKNTNSVESKFIKRYFNSLGGKFDSFSKVTLADLFEVALNEFLNDNSVLYF